MTEERRRYIELKMQADPAFRAEAEAARARSEARRASKFPLVGSGLRGNVPSQTITQPEQPPFQRFVAGLPSPDILGPAISRWMNNETVRPISEHGPVERMARSFVAGGDATPRYVGPGSNLPGPVQDPTYSQLAPFQTGVSAGTGNLAQLIMAMESAGLLPGLSKLGATVAATEAAQVAAPTIAGAARAAVEQGVSGAAKGAVGTAAYDLLRQAVDGNLDVARAAQAGVDAAKFTGPMGAVSGLGAGLPAAQRLVGETLSQIPVSAAITGRTVKEAALSPEDLPMNVYPLVMAAIAKRAGTRQAFVEKLRKRVAEMREEEATWKQMSEEGVDVRKHAEEFVAQEMLSDEATRAEIVDEMKAQGVPEEQIQVVLNTIPKPKVRGTAQDDPKFGKSPIVLRYPSGREAVFLFRPDKDNRTVSVVRRDLSTGQQEVINSGVDPMDLPVYLQRKMKRGSLEFVGYGDDVSPEKATEALSETISKFARQHPWAEQYGKDLIDYYTGVRKDMPVAPAVDVANPDAVQALNRKIRKTVNKMAKEYVQDESEQSAQPNPEPIPGLADKAQPVAVSPPSSLYEQAVKIVRADNKVSISEIQRKLRIGYSQAASLISEMEANGIVSPFDGTKPRTVIGAEPAPSAEEPPVISGEETPVVQKSPLDIANDELAAAQAAVDAIRARYSAKDVSDEEMAALGPKMREASARLGEAQRKVEGLDPKVSTVRPPRTTEDFKGMSEAQLAAAIADLRSEQRRVENPTRTPGVELPSKAYAKQVNDELALAVAERRSRQGQTPAPQSAPAPDRMNPDEAQARVFEALGDSPMDIDKLVEATGMSAPDIMAAMTFMEMKKTAVRGKGGWTRGESSPPPDKGEHGEGDGGVVSPSDEPPTPPEPSGNVIELRRMLREEVEPEDAVDPDWLVNTLVRLNEDAAPEDIVEIDTFIGEVNAALKESDLDPIPDEVVAEVKRAFDPEAAMGDDGEGIPGGFKSIEEFAGDKPAEDQDGTWVRYDGPNEDGSRGYTIFDPNNPELQGKSMNEADLEKAGFRAFGKSTGKSAETYEAEKIFGASVEEYKEFISKAEEEMDALNKFDQSYPKGEDHPDIVQAKRNLFFLENAGTEAGKLSKNGIHSILSAYSKDSKKDVSALFRRYKETGSVFPDDIEWMSENKRLGEGKSGSRAESTPGASKPAAPEISEGLVDPTVKSESGPEAGDQAVTRTREMDEQEFNLVKIAGAGDLSGRSLSDEMTRLELVKERVRKEKHFAGASHEHASNLLSAQIKELKALIEKYGGDEKLSRFLDKGGQYIAGSSKEWWQMDRNEFWPSLVTDKVSDRDRVDAIHRDRFAMLPDGASFNVRNKKYKKATVDGKAVLLDANGEVRDPVEVLFGFDSVVKETFEREQLKRFKSGNSVKSESEPVTIGGALQEFPSKDFSLKIPDTLIGSFKDGYTLGSDKLNNNIPSSPKSDAFLLGVYARKNRLTGEVRKSRGYTWSIGDKIIRVEGNDVSETDAREAITGQKPSGEKPPVLDDIMNRILDKFSEKFEGFERGSSGRDAVVAGAKRLADLDGIPLSISHIAESLQYFEPGGDAERTFRGEFANYRMPDDMKERALAARPELGEFESKSSASPDTSPAASPDRDQKIKEIQERLYKDELRDWKAANPGKDVTPEMEAIGRRNVASAAANIYDTVTRNLEKGDVGKLLSTLHSKNKNTRKLFEELSGVKIGSGKDAVKDAVIKAVGQEAYDKHLADQKKAQEEADAAKEQRRRDRDQAEFDKDPKLNGFLASIPDKMASGRAKKILYTSMRYNGVVKSRKVFVEESAAAGKIATQRRILTQQGMSDKLEWAIGGPDKYDPFVTVTKTEADYLNYLLGNKQETAAVSSKPQTFDEIGIERVTEIADEIKKSDGEVYVPPQLTIDDNGKARPFRTAAHLRSLGLVPGEKANYWMKPKEEQSQGPSQVYSNAEAMSKAIDAKAAAAGPGKGGKSHRAVFFDMLPDVTLESFVTDGKNGYPQKHQLSVRKATYEEAKDFGSPSAGYVVVLERFSGESKKDLKSQGGKQLAGFGETPESALYDAMFVSGRFSADMTDSFDALVYAPESRGLTVADVSRHARMLTHEGLRNLPKDLKEKVSEANTRFVDGENRVTEFINSTENDDYAASLESRGKADNGRHLYGIDGIDSHILLEKTSDGRYNVAVTNSWETKYNGKRGIRVESRWTKKPTTLDDAISRLREAYSELRNERAIVQDEDARDLILGLSGAELRATKKIWNEATESVKESKEPFPRDRFGLATAEGVRILDELKNSYRQNGEDVKWFDEMSNKIAEVLSGMSDNSGEPYITAGGYLNPSNKYIQEKLGKEAAKMTVGGNKPPDPFTPKELGRIEELLNLPSQEVSVSFKSSTGFVAKFSGDKSKRPGRSLGFKPQVLVGNEWIDVQKGKYSEHTFEHAADQNKRWVPGRGTKTENVGDPEKSGIERLQDVDDGELRIADTGEPATPRQEAIYNKRATNAIVEIARGLFTKKIKNRADVIRLVNDVFETHVGKGGFMQLRVDRGFFAPLHNFIRLRKDQDMRVLSHELGHLLDKEHGLLKKWLGVDDPARYLDAEDIPDAHVYNLAEDLWGLSKEVRPGLKDSDYPTLHAKAMEGVADFVRLYLINPDKAHRLAPGFYEMFDREMRQNPSRFRALSSMQDFLMSFYGVDADTRLEMMINRDGGNRRMMSMNPADWMRKIYQDWVYDGAPLQALESKVRNLKRGEYVHGVDHAYTMLGGLGGKIEQYWRDRMTPVLERVTKGLKDADATERLKNVERLAIAKRIISRNEPGTDFTYNDAIDVVNKYRDDKAMNDAVDAITDYSKGLIHLMRDAGLITADKANEIISSDEVYIPMWSVKGDGVVIPTGQKLANLATPVKKWTGTKNADLLPPLESLVHKTAWVLSTVAKERVGQEVYRLSKTPESGEFIRELDADAVNKYVKKTKHLPPNTFMVHVDGEAKFLEVSDQSVYNAMLAMDPLRLPMVFETMKPFARGLRTGVILDFAYTIRNFYRDQLTASVMSENKLLPFVDAFTTLFRDVLPKSEVYLQAKREGGFGASLASLDFDTVSQLAYGDKIKSSSLWRTGNLLGHPIDFMRAFSEAAELSTRLAEYKLSYKNSIAKGMSESAARQKAAYDMRNVTVDFHRAGITGRKVNQVSAFFNAQVQGFDRTVKAFEKDPIKATQNAILFITLPALTHAMMVMGEDDETREAYLQLPEWRRVGFMNFPVHGSDKSVSGWVSIPRVPGPLNVLFGVLPEKLVEYAAVHDKESLKRGVWASAKKEVDLSQYAVPDALKPFVDNMMNRTWSGVPLYTWSETRLSPHLRANSHTSHLADWLSQQVHDVAPDAVEGLSSPQMIDNYISSWGGTLGGTLSSSVGSLMEATGVSEEKANRQTASKIPILGQFYIERTRYTAASVSNFYDALAKAERQHADIKRLDEIGRTQEAQELRLDKETATVTELQQLRHIESRLSDIRKREREVMLDKDLPRDQKRKILIELNNQKTDWTAEWRPGAKRSNSK